MRISLLRINHYKQNMTALMCSRAAYCAFITSFCKYIECPTGTAHYWTCRCTHCFPSLTLRERIAGILSLPNAKGRQEQRFWTWLSKRWTKYFKCGPTVGTGCQDAVRYILNEAVSVHVRCVSPTGVGGFIHSKGTKQRRTPLHLRSRGCLVVWLSKARCFSNVRDRASPPGSSA